MAYVDKVAERRITPESRKDRYVYIASPYSDPDKQVMMDRYHRVTKYAASCCAKGEIVYSPIAHNHVMAEMKDLPTTWDFWKRIDFAFLGWAKELRVLCLPGWSKSVGVTDEIQFAKTFHIPIVYVEYSDEFTN